MTETTHEITSADVGTVLPVVDGWITALRMTAGPSRYENAAFKSDRGAWASSYFSLCGVDDVALVGGNLICVDQNNGVKRFINLSIGYRGGLRIRSVPHGSQWSITLSDQQPVVRKAA